MQRVIQDRFLNSFDHYLKFDRRFSCLLKSLVKLASTGLFFPQILEPQAHNLNFSKNTLRFLKQDFHLLVTGLWDGDFSPHRNVMITIINVNFMRLDLRYVWGGRRVLLNLWIFEQGNASSLGGCQCCA